MSNVLREIKDQTVVEFDKPTMSGKIYSKDCIITALNDPILKEKLDTKSFYCELRSPFNTGSDNRTNLMNVATCIDGMFVEDNKLKVDLSILDTPMGNVVNKLMNDNQVVSLGIRGSGDISKDGAVTNLEIYGIDCIYPTIKGNRDKV